MRPPQTHVRHLAGPRSLMAMGFAERFEADGCGQLRITEIGRLASGCSRKAYGEPNRTRASEAALLAARRAVPRPVVDFAPMLLSA